MRHSALIVDARVAQDSTCEEGNLEEEDYMHHVEMWANQWFSCRTPGLLRNTEVLILVKTTFGMRTLRILSLYSQISCRNYWLVVPGKNKRFGMGSERSHMG